MCCKGLCSRGAAAARSSDSATGGKNGTRYCLQWQPGEVPRPTAPVEYKRRKLRRKGTVKYQCVTDLSGWEAAFEVLKTSHTKRWRERGIPGVFASPQFTRFHRKLAQCWCAQGGMQIHLLHLEGTRPSPRSTICAGAEGVFLSVWRRCPPEGGSRPELRCMPLPSKGGARPVDCVRFPLAGGPFCTKAHLAPPSRFSGGPWPVKLGAAASAGGYNAMAESAAQNAEREQLFSGNRNRRSAIDVEIEILVADLLKCHSGAGAAIASFIFVRNSTSALRNANANAVAENFGINVHLPGERKPLARRCLENPGMH